MKKVIFKTHSVLLMVGGCCRHGFNDSSLIVSRLPFLANLLDFSLLGVSQAASISSKLSQKFLTERCYTVSICLFFTKARQKCEGMLAHCEYFYRRFCEKESIETKKARVFKPKKE